MTPAQIATARADANGPDPVAAAIASTKLALFSRATLQQPRPADDADLHRITTDQAAEIVQALIDFEMIRRQLGDPTIWAHRTATAAIGRLK